MVPRSPDNRGCTVYVIGFLRESHINLVGLITPVNEGFATEYPTTSQLKKIQLAKLKNCDYFQNFPEYQRDHQQIV